MADFSLNLPDLLPDLPDIPVEPEPSPTSQVPVEVPVPSAGRMVCYVDAVDGLVPAIITRTDEDGAFLTVFFPSRLPGYTTSPVPYSASQETDTWHWPPRV